MGFESGLTQLAGPRAQCPVRSVPPEIDHAVSDLGDDAGRWFLVGLVADPWVFESCANVVFHHGGHFFTRRYQLQRSHLTPLRDKPRRVVCFFDPDQRILSR